MATSESVRLAMERIFNGLRREYRLAGEDFTGPRLERIPLGVPAAQVPGPAERWDAPAFSLHEKAPGSESLSEDQGRAARDLRSRLGLDREVVFLSLGRICPYSKMDLMPLFPALLRAQRLGLPKGGYALILAGWTNDEERNLPEALQSYAHSLGIRLIPRIRPTDAERRALYAAADVFLSPSDNIQESFGLTVAEAGAAGLPVIASDFDGYRDIVAHEQSGLLVPTLGFADTRESEVQAMFWFDNQYHLKLSQSCALHIPALAEALARLGTDESLRRRMGEAGRKRVRELFAWDRVITRQVSLWDELAAVPLTAEREYSLRAAGHPQLMRFGEYFHGHFTQTLDETALAGMLLQRTETGDALYRGAIPLAHYAGMEQLLDSEAVRRMLLAARKPISGPALMRLLLEFFQGRSPAPFVQERANFTLLWALKHDYLEDNP
jgi:glycosyltransferase involved in cell wall biosynthesis